MKRLILAAMGAAMLSPAAIAEPPSYPLICRGGPSTRIMFAHDVPDGVNPTTNNMTVFFRPGANANNPAPGECVWADRGFRPGEPGSFVIKGDVKFSMQIMGDGRLVRDGSGLRFRAEGTSPQANDWNYIVDKLMTGNLATVQVYNAGPVMAVTRVGP